MNILPLVLALLIIFVMSTQSLLKQRIATHWEGHAFFGRMEAGRKARNEVESKKYKAAEGVAQKTESSSTSNKKDKEYVSRREISRPHEDSRLNIGLLVSAPTLPAYDRLYETCAKLIRSLYGHADFYKEKLEYQILDLLIENGKKSILEFSEMIPEDAAFYPLFYKAVKGTNRYDLKTKQGYPPLSDFLLIDLDKARKPIHFCFASAPLLKAFLGDEFTAEILQKEKEKWEPDHKQRTVTKKELGKMFAESYGLGFQLVDIADLLNFSKRAGPRPTAIGIEETSGIHSRHAL